MNRAEKRQHALAEAYNQGYEDGRDITRRTLAPLIDTVELELLMSHNSEEGNEAVKALVAFRDGDE